METDVPNGIKPGDAREDGDSVLGFGEVQAEVNGLVDVHRRRSVQGQADFADIQNFGKIVGFARQNSAKGRISGDMHFLANTSPAVGPWRLWNLDDGGHYTTRITRVYINPILQERYAGRK